MSLLPILRYPDSRLHKIAKPVTVFDERLKKLVADMAETMYEAPGVGLAATQVDIHERIIVIDVSEEQNQLMVFINPELVWASAEKKAWREGCLSVPEQYADVARPAVIKAKWLDADGKEHVEQIDGLLATCLQHEMDHLNGILFIDHLSKLKRDIVLKKLAKARKMAA